MPLRNLRLLWLRMAVGSRWDLTGVAGIRQELWLSGVLIARENGFGPIAAGTGRAKSRGGGPVITMDIGLLMRGTAGFGCRELNGLQLGCPGERGEATSVGLLCRRRV